jgi:hypothetical protein
MRFAASDILFDAHVGIFSENRCSLFGIML